MAINDQSSSFVGSPSILILDTRGSTLFANEQAEKKLGSQLKNGLKNQLVSKVVSAVVKKFIEPPIKIPLSDGTEVYVLDLSQGDKLIYTYDYASKDLVTETPEELFVREVIKPIKFLTANMQLNKTNVKDIDTLEGIKSISDYFHDYKIANDMHPISIASLIETIKNSIYCEDDATFLHINSSCKDDQFNGHLEQLTALVRICLRRLHLRVRSTISIQIHRNSRALTIFLFSRIARNKYISLPSYSDLSVVKSTSVAEVLIGLQGGTVDFSSEENGLISIHIPIKNEVQDKKENNLLEKQLYRYAEDISKLSHDSMRLQLERYAEDLATLQKQLNPYRIEARE
jgi:hypothetical protein